MQCAEITTKKSLQIQGREFNKELNNIFILTQPKISS